MDRSNYDAEISLMSSQAGAEGPVDPMVLGKDHQISLVGEKVLGQAFRTLARKLGMTAQECFHLHPVFLWLQRAGRIDQ
jgi:hypothetical protein